MGNEANSNIISKQQKQKNGTTNQKGKSGKTFTI